jgi:hypothetical protein
MDWLSSIGTWSSFLGIPVTLENGAGQTSNGVFNLDLGVMIARETLMMLGRQDPDMYFELPGFQGHAYVDSERNVKNALIGPYFPDGVSPVLFVVGKGPGSVVPWHSGGSFVAEADGRTAQLNRPAVVIRLPRSTACWYDAGGGR